MGWYEAVKDAVGFAGKLRNAELDLKLATIRMEGTTLTEENVRLREEVLELRQQVALQLEMEYRDNVYWRRRPDGEAEGPFCPKCLDGSRRASRMQERADDRFWRCHTCDRLVRRPGTEPQRPVFCAASPWA